MSANPTPDDVREKILAVYAENNAISVATVGGPRSPWILGAYFANDGLDLVLLLEAHGKSFQNISADPAVAVSISQNDAMKDFVQASGVARILDAAEEPGVRALFVEKMPWFQTYTPVVPVRIEVTDVFVSSLTSGWFPAKQLSVR